MFIKVVLFKHNGKFSLYNSPEYVGQDEKLIFSVQIGQEEYFEITGPGWKGQAPGRIVQFASRDNAVLLFGRVLMYSHSDVSTAYVLAK